MEAVVKNGCTVILVSHDLGAIEILCDTFSILFEVKFILLAALGTEYQRTEKTSLKPKTYPKTRRRSIYRQEANHEPITETPHQKVTRLC